MALKIAYFVFILKTVNSIQINHPGIPQPIDLPQATGYIYRSDNDGPASIIQLGSNQQLYQQPHIFATPLPLTKQALHTKAIASDDNSVVPSAKVIDTQGEEEYEEGDGEDYEEEYEEYDDDGDEAVAEADQEVAPKQAISVEEETDDETVASVPEVTAKLLTHHRDNHHNFERGGGGGYLDEKSSSHGEKAREEYDSKQAFDKGEKGHHENEEHQEYDSEKGGKTSKHLDEADKYGKHHAEESGQKGEDFQHKKAFKKGEKVTGYHNIYKKDEYKKNKEFYDEADESGHFKKHGDGHSKYGSSEGAKKKVAHHKSGHEQAASGRKGHFEKGHRDEKDAGHKKEHGEESFYNDHQKHSKKGGNSENKEYEYEE